MSVIFDILEIIIGYVVCTIILSFNNNIAISFVVI